MKKILVCLLAFVLLITPFSINVAAAPTPTFVVSAVSGKAGETVKINVSVQNNTGIISMKLLLQYDSTALEIVDVEDAQFKGVAYGDTKKVPFVMNWIEPLNPNNKTNGTVATVTFKILNTAQVGKSEVSLTYSPSDVFDSNFNHVAFQVQNGYVDVTESGTQPNTSSQNNNSENNSSENNSSENNSSENNSFENNTSSSNSSENSSSQVISKDDNVNTTSSTTVNSTEQSTNDDNNEKSQEWIIWVVAGAIVVLVGAFAVIIIKGKKEE